MDILCNGRPKVSTFNTCTNYKFLRSNVYKNAISSYEHRTNSFVSHIKIWGKRKNEIFWFLLMISVCSSNQLKIQHVYSQIATSEIVCHCCALRDNGSHPIQIILYFILRWGDKLFPIAIFVAAGNAFFPIEIFIDNNGSTEIISELTIGEWANGFGKVSITNAFLFIDLVKFRRNGHLIIIINITCCIQSVASLYQTHGSSTGAFPISQRCGSMLHCEYTLLYIWSLFDRTVCDVRLLKGFVLRFRILCPLFHSSTHAHTHF